MFIKLTNGPGGRGGQATYYNMDLIVTMYEHEAGGSVICEAGMLPDNDIISYRVMESPEQIVAMIKNHG